MFGPAASGRTMARGRQARAGRSNLDSFTLPWWSRNFSWSFECTIERLDKTHQNTVNLCKNEGFGPWASWNVLVHFLRPWTSWKTSLKTLTRYLLVVSTSHALHSTCHILGVRSPLVFIVMMLFTILTILILLVVRLIIITFILIFILIFILSSIHHPFTLFGTPSSWCRPGFSGFVCTLCDVSCQGKLTFADGSKYEGQFESDRKHGVGKLGPRFQADRWWLLMIVDDRWWLLMIVDDSYIFKHVFQVSQVSFPSCTFFQCLVFIMFSSSLRLFFWLHFLMMVLLDGSTGCFPQKFQGTPTAMGPPMKASGKWRPEMALLFFGAHRQLSDENLFFFHAKTWCILMQNRYKMAME